MTTLYVLFTLLLVCMVYLTVDWIVDEYRKSKKERDEMKSWIDDY